MPDLNGSDAVFLLRNIGPAATRRSEARRPCGRGGRTCITGRGEDAARTGISLTRLTGQPERMVVARISPPNQSA